jgi:hypothetical protein
LVGEGLEHFSSALGIVSKPYDHGRHIHYDLFSLLSLRILFEGGKLNLHILKIVPLLYINILQGPKG